MTIISAKIPTSNKYEALAAEEIKEQDSHSETAPAMPVRSCRRRWKVLVVAPNREALRHSSASLLCSQGKSATCQELRSRMLQRLPKLLKGTHHFLLLFHMGTNNMVQHSLSKIKQDFRVLRSQVKGTEDQIISSILPVRDRGMGRSHCTMQVNIQLHAHEQQREKAHLSE